MPPKSIRNAFPKASQYDPEWVRKHSMGENVLFNLESLTKSLDLKPGMRVLDLGCGSGFPIGVELNRLGFQLAGIDASTPDPADGRIEREHLVHRFRVLGWDHTIPPRDARAGSSRAKGPSRPADPSS